MLRVRTLFTGVPGSPYYSNLFFDGSLSTDATAAAQAVRAMWNANAGALINGMTATVDSFVPSINPENGAVIGGFVVDAGAPVAFTNSSTRLPPANQVLLRLRTGVYVTGREVAGKLFIPGIPASVSTTAGTPLQARLDEFTSRAQTLLATGPDWGIWSRKAGTFAPISQVQAANFFAVLRSRRD